MAPTEEAQDKKPQPKSPELRGEGEGTLAGASIAEAMRLTLRSAS
jgi:hypothetical protein